MNQFAAQDTQGASGALAQIPPHVIERFKRRMDGNVRLEKLKPEVREIVSRSSRPGAYLRFIAGRDPFMPAFRASADVLANGRMVVFSKVSGEAAERGRRIIRLLEKKEGAEERLGKIMAEAARLSGHTAAQAAEAAKALLMGAKRGELRDAKDVLAECGIYLLSRNDGETLPLTFRGIFERSGISAYVLADPTPFIERGWGGHTHGTEMAVVSEDPRLVQHEMQHVFDNAANMFRNPGARKGGEREEEYAQRAGSHLEYEYRKMEYRAKLAELAFGADLGAAYKSLTESWSIAHGLNDIFGGTLACSMGHFRADLMVYYNLLIREELFAQTPETGPGWLREFALRCLNEAYMEQAGLTYDELLEPFRAE